MRIKLFVMVVLFSITTGYSQGDLWSKADESKLQDKEKMDRESTPVKYDLFSLNMQEMMSRLQQAPQRGAAETSSVIVSFPNGEGGFENFRIYEASVLHPDLAAQHTDIKSYVGQGIENKSHSVRFSVTMYGLHAMILSPEGTTYTDTYTKDKQNYISYKKSAIKTARTFGCEVIDETDHSEHENAPMSVQSNDGVLRTYRLAMACTVEYAAFHVNAAGLNNATEAQKKAAVLAAMTVTMTRVNGVYERDMSLTMQLIPNNENIIFINSDNFNNNNAGVLIGQSQSVINNTIGFNNYDIGHVVSTGGGGLAQLGCVCTSNKARGITGSPAPVGDPYDIDYVAHEMGHQFGANHTFNNPGQRNANTAVEPGSGSTIMAYAGISPPNIQNNSDAYFHTVSITQMINFINGVGGFCATTTNNNNSTPEIAPLTSYTIPKGTAFVLRGNATDADNDDLTYSWEQVDANGASSTQGNLPSPNSTSGPNFRSLPPSESPDRYMPALPSVLSGNLTPTWEVVPNVARNMTFALTVRDNQTANGGQTARRNMNVTVNGTAGPFEVTSQDTESISWEQGSQQTITWNVAGTTANNVNTQNVNILLSTDGGQTFDTVLASNTPNDGSETITVPNIEAALCRIMVEGAGNIFYAVNDIPFSIGVVVTTTCETYTFDSAFAIPDANPQLTVTSVNVPDDVTITSVNVGVNISHTFLGDLAFVVASPSQTQAVLWDQQCNNSQNLNAVFSDSGSTVDCGSPTTGTITPLQPLSAFNGESSQGNWFFGIADFAQQDTGTVNSWFVEICTLGTAGLDSNSLQNFSLYPNPNEGSFTVAFNSNSANDIKVSVHDMRGREIYNSSFQNTGMFSGNIDLQNAQTGIYMVTVQDGSKKAVEKIVIK